VRPQYFPTHSAVGAVAQAVALRKLSTRFRLPPLACQSNRLDGQHADSCFHISNRGMVLGKQSQSVRIHSSEEHVFRFQKLKLRRPTGI